MLVMMAAGRADSLVLKRLDCVVQRRATLHCGKNIVARKGIPLGGNDHRFGIVFLDKGYRLVDLILQNACRMTENDTRRALDLIVEELTEITHIHLTLFRVNDGNEAVQRKPFVMKVTDCADNIRELADAGGLDNNALGRIFLNDLRKRLSEIAYERAADTARIHLVDHDARIGKKAAVNADLTELIFNEHDLFAGIGLLYELFNERRLTRAQKARKNIGFNGVCHRSHLPIKNFIIILQYNTQAPTCQIKNA